MKRTEALKLIREALLGMQIDHDNFDEQILSVVEKVGMTPPIVYKSSGCLHSISECCSCRDSVTYEWESE